jgi:hypothetical protein
MSTRYVLQAIVADRRPQFPGIGLISSQKYHSIHAKGGRPEDLTEEELNLLQYVVPPPRFCPRIWRVRGIANAKAISLRSQPAVKTETPDGDQTTAAPPAGPADEAGAGAAQSVCCSPRSAPIEKAIRFLVALGCIR